MLADLIDGARRLRVPLATGYATILTVWLWSVHKVPVGTERSLFTERLGLVAEAIGPTGRIALISLAAIVIGSGAERLFLGHLLYAIETRIGSRHWDDAIQAAKNEVGTYEQGKDHSGFVAAGLARVVDELERDRSDARFRFALALLSMPVIVTAAALGGLTWLWTFVAPAAVLSDARTLGFVSDQHRAAPHRLLRQDGLAKLEEAMGSGEYSDTQVAELQTVVDEVRSDLKTLEKRDFDEASLIFRPRTCSHFWHSPTDNKLKI